VLEYLEVHEQATVRGVAGALSLHENTARGHLEGLVEAGLARRERAPVRGRGRPAIQYRADVWAQADPRIRDYAHLASALATFLSTTSPDPQADARTAGLTWGSSMVEGREPQTPRQARREVVAVLADLGFDPKTDSGAASVALRRCPLLDVARTHTDVVCQVHLGLVQGAMTEMGQDASQADLRPFSEPGACRLILKPPRGG